jgi:hypothetical protein
MENTDTIRASIDDNDISTLCHEAAQAGDEPMAELCEKALAGDAAARRECEDVIISAALDAPCSCAGCGEDLSEDEAIFDGGQPLCKGCGEVAR